MLMALATLLLVGAGAAAVLYWARAGTAPAAAAQPLEILFGPQDLHRLLAATETAGRGGAALPAVRLDPSQAMKRLHELALGPAASANPAPEHAAVTTAVIAATESAATLRQLAPRRPSLLPQLIRAANDDAAPRRELAAIIRRDPSLVGNLLEMA
ncbi:MAG TPA: hypothetical protein VGG96_10525, partial [Steroidobacteraceae bacterium]